MNVTVCPICLEPLTTGGAVTPVHAACLGVDADLLAEIVAARLALTAATRAVEAAEAAVRQLNRGRPKVYLGLKAAIARAERTTITDEPNGTDAPNQGDDHAE